MEPRPPNRIIHSPGGEFSIGSCDWETSPKESALPTLQSFALMATPNASEEAETAEEEVFSTPEQMIGHTAEAQTNPSSPPTSFLTPEVHSISTGADAGISQVTFLLSDRIWQIRLVLNPRYLGRGLFIPPFLGPRMWMSLSRLPHCPFPETR